MSRSATRARLLVGLSAVAILAAACTGGASPSPSAAASTAPSAAKMYTIGFSNTGGTGNGFREEQNCTAKAEALASGQVSKVDMIARDADTAQQLADLRTLIAGKPDAIVFNPSHATALQAAIDEAQAAGILMVAVDAYVEDPETWKFYNNQVDYAYLGAKWLFEQLGGKGKVWYTRGIAGHPADTDRHTGFQKALAENPGIEVVPNKDGVHTEWNPTIATNLANEFISSGQYDTVDGVWTSGMDSQVVDAVKAAGKPYKPIVGADLGAFAKYLGDDTNYPGLVGAAVTNTAAVGGAGVNLALKVLNGETVQADPSAPYPNTVLLKPVLADNTSEAGKATLTSWQTVEGLNPIWPLSVTVDGWTTYTPEQAIACKGPGE
ncbi:MAG TPA: substrate-binding domain-containing protein [Candidatus Limnocylindrales bacterium]|nr:substrate-binding domain-containing protein [Candidatus Limnocylindrales bacterium]